LAKYGLTDSTRLENLMVFWMCNKLTGYKKPMSLEYIAKNHENVINASHELGHGLAQYLSRHKTSDEKIGKHFKIEKTKFSRRYAPFLRDCIYDLDDQLSRLERQIIEKLSDD
jgi:hypothetical protein